MGGGRGGGARRGVTIYPYNPVEGTHFEVVAKSHEPARRVYGLGLELRGPELGEEFRVRGSGLRVHWMHRYLLAQYIRDQCLGVLYYKHLRTCLMLSNFRQPRKISGLCNLITCQCVSDPACCGRWSTTSAPELLNS